MKRTAIGCAIAGGVLAVLLLNPVGCAILSVFIGMGQIRMVESAMRDPMVYEPVAETLALYCQSDQSLLPQYMNYAWLPEELNAIGHGWASVSTNYAHIEMGGGFYHFGYRLTRDVDTSSTDTNVWQLHMYREGSQGRHLKTLQIDSERRYPPEKLLARVVAGYDEQIHRKPDDVKAHQGKIQAYLRFDHVNQAREACRSMLKTLPDHWWPVLVNALIVAEEDSPKKATETISQWVEKDKNFFRFMDLAYFHQLTGPPLRIDFQRRFFWCWSEIEHT